LIKEAIILAGGLGTRLKEVVPDLPKSMALVAGLPFLTYVIRHLLSQGIERFIFSLGYKHELIEGFLSNHYAYLDYQTIVEQQPLGTGGAIRFALSTSVHRDVLVVNGDTLYKIDVEALAELHIERQADCTLALKPMENFDRYGMVEIDGDMRIKRFAEKKAVAKGYINGGAYLLNKVSFLKKTFPAAFSFEKDFLSKQVETQLFYGLVQDKYFVDIGIPEDFEKAQKELSYPSLALNKIDPSWTLFLDRDGVINVNKDESYVFNTGEFQFLPGAPEAIARLRSFFGRIIIVTNQRGIGKGLMDEQALADIHQHMIDHIEAAGGKIDALYYCAINDEKHHDRKPNPGMPLEAAKMFSEIDFSRSIMVGDKLSDMELGRNTGAFTVLITPKPEEDYLNHLDIDLRFESLAAFAEKSSSIPGNQEQTVNFTLP
jgi:D-glycero-alpha-D-manno-heptose 1-phosphate guanylyltransferase